MSSEQTSGLLSNEDRMDDIIQDDTHIVDGLRSQRYPNMEDEDAEYVEMLESHNGDFDRPDFHDSLMDSSSESEFAESAIDDTDVLEEIYRKKGKTYVKRKVAHDKTKKDNPLLENYYLWWIWCPYRGTIKIQNFFRHILESTPYNMMIVLLVMIDLTCVMFELFIDLRVFGQKGCECEACPHPNATDFNAIMYSRRLFEEEEGRPHCELEEEPEWEEDTAFFLWIISCSILTLFVLEIPLKIFAYRWRFLYCSHVFDSLVVLVSWVFDVFFKKYEAAALLIILRLWRLMRVGHGIIHFFEVKSERKMEKELHRAHKHSHVLEEELKMSLDALKVAQHEIRYCKRKLVKSGVIGPHDRLFPEMVKEMPLESGKPAVSDNIVRHDIELDVDDHPSARKAGVDSKARSTPQRNASLSPENSLLEGGINDDGSGGGASGIVSMKEMDSDEIEIRDDEIGPGLL